MLHGGFTSQNEEKTQQQQPVSQQSTQGSHALTSQCFAVSLLFVEVQVICFSHHQFPRYCLPMKQLTADQEYTKICLDSERILLLCPPHDANGINQDKSLRTTLSNVPTPTLLGATVTQSTPKSNKQVALISSSFVMYFLYAVFL